MIDQWDNPIIEVPKMPSKVLYTITPDNVRRLIQAASSLRNKAMISLMADSGGCTSEIANFEAENLDLENYGIKVMGKGK